METKNFILTLTIMIVIVNVHGQSCSSPTCDQPGYTLKTKGSTAYNCIMSASNTCSTAIGDSTQASGDRSLAMGNKLIASGDNSIVMGLGLLGTGLTNNFAKSLMVGFDSDSSTFFVGPGTGNSGSFGNVGIATSVPGFRLDVNEGDINAITSTKGYRIGGDYVLWHNNKTGCINVGTRNNVTTSNGTYNTFVGNDAGYSNSSGNDNTLMGYQAGYTKSTGNKNTIIGSQAGYGSSSTYSETTMVGYQAGYSNTSGNHNTFLGTYAGSSNTTSDYNTFVGWESGRGNSTGGGYNTFVGHLSGRYNTTGGNNVNIGYAAGFNALTGSANTFLGSQAGYTNTTHSSNVFVGYNAGQNSDADDNTAIGRSAGINTTSGAQNVFVGRSAGYTNITGQYNTAVGRSAGSSNTTDTACTFIGYGADASGNYNNATAIGYGAIATVGNSVELGNASVTLVHGPVAYTYSDGRFKFNVQNNVKGLEFIKKLRPITYQMDTKAADDFIIQSMPDSVKAIHQTGMDFAPSTAIVHSGFIAQEVDSVAQVCGFSSSLVHKPANNTDHYSLAYAEFVVPLVKAVQEQQNMIDSILAILAPQNERKANTGSNENSGENIQKSEQDIKLKLPDSAILGDAQPNPNSGSTQINYYLPPSISKAKIIFIDMLGRTMEERILQPGYGLLNIDTMDLPGGVYSYSLVIDGKVVDNKRIVRNK